MWMSGWAEAGQERAGLESSVGLDGGPGSTPAAAGVAVRWCFSDKGHATRRPEVSSCLGKEAKLEFLATAVSPCP